jgi:hypothetical protein
MKNNAQKMREEYDVETIEPDVKKKMAPILDRLFDEKINEFLKKKEQTLKQILRVKEEYTINFDKRIAAYKSESC